MHTDQKYIKDWVDYSCLDAEITYFIYNILEKQLKELAIEK